MVQILPALLAVASIVASTSATNLKANSGCIIEAISNRKVCGSPIQVSGNVEIIACIDRSRPKNKYFCTWKGFIPYHWDQAFWGADNCMYSAGKNPIQLGCASSAYGETSFNVY